MYAKFVLGLLALAGVNATLEAANPVVVMETSKGSIKIELNAEKAPISVKNFLSYVEDKHYEGLTFHRVIEDFMIQGGGYDADQKQRKTKPPIKNESGNGLSNVRGSIAMARTQVLDSATSQFFINVKDNLQLDTGKYCVFGRVIEGMDIVDKIRYAETGRKGMFSSDVPQEDILIKSVKVVEAKK